MGLSEGQLLPYQKAKLKEEIQILQLKKVEEKYRIQIEAFELAKRKLESLKTTGQEPGEIQRTQLNGAQIASLLQIIESVTEGKLPVDSGVTVLQVAFPDISAELAETILAPIREKQDEEQRKEEEREEERENPSLSVFGDDEDEEEDSEEDETDGEDEDEEDEEDEEFDEGDGDFADIFEDVDEAFGEEEKGIFTVDIE